MVRPATKHDVDSLGLSAVRHVEDATFALLRLASAAFFYDCGVRRLVEMGLKAKSR